MDDGFCCNELGFWFPWVRRWSPFLSSYQGYVLSNQFIALPSHTGKLCWSWKGHSGRVHWERCGDVELMDCLTTGFAAKCENDKNIFMIEKKMRSAKRQRPLPIDQSSSVFLIELKLSSYSVAFKSNSKLLLATKLVRRSRHSETKLRRSFLSKTPLFDIFRCCRSST